MRNKKAAALAGFCRLRAAAAARAAALAASLKRGSSPCESPPKRHRPPADARWQPVRPKPWEEMAELDRAVRARRIKRWKGVEEGDAIMGEFGVWE